MLPCRCLNEYHAIAASQVPQDVLRAQISACPSTMKRNQTAWRVSSGPSRAAWCEKTACTKPCPTRGYPQTCKTYGMRPAAHGTNGDTESGPKALSLQGQTPRLRMYVCMYVCMMYVCAWVGGWVGGWMGGWAGVLDILVRRVLQGLVTGCSMFAAFAHSKSIVRGRAVACVVRGHLFDTALRTSSASANCSRSSSLDSTYLGKQCKPPSSTICGPTLPESFCILHDLARYGI